MPARSWSASSAGLLLWWFAGHRYDEAVADLAPAPIGCDTTLVFDRTGTYTLFVETKGEVGEIDGDCDADDRTYDLGDEEPPDVELVAARRAAATRSTSTAPTARPTTRPAPRARASRRSRSTSPVTTC